jgi:2-methylcitrate dehydratase PrpD
MNAGLPKISVAQRLAEKIVALKPGELPAITTRKCKDLLLATGVVHGGVGLGAFTDAAIRDPRVLALAAKVKYVIDPDNPYPNNYTGHIRAIMKDGSVIEERQPYLRGGAQKPLTRGDVREKYNLNVKHAGWTKAQGEAALKLVMGLYNEHIDLSSLRG